MRVGKLVFKDNGLGLIHKLCILCELSCLLFFAPDPKALLQVLKFSFLHKIQPFKIFIQP